MKIKRRNFLELIGVSLTAMRGMPAQAQRPLPKSEYGYIDWRWERWRKITGSKRPRLVTEQTGQAELTDLLIRSGEKITGAEQWQAQRDSIKRVLQVFLGASPKTKPPLEPKVMEEMPRDNHMLRKLVYQTEPGEFVPAYLLIPKSILSIGGRVPAIICPHQTTQAGKREPAGLAGNPQLQTALHLVERGYVTFT